MNSSRWSKMLAVLPLVGALAGFTGCNNPQNTDDESTDVAPSELQGAAPAAAKDGTPERARPEGRGHARGPAFLLGAALHELTLTDAQKATIQGELDALETSAKAGGAERGAEHETNRKALADAIRAGKVDEAAFAKEPGKPAMDQARIAKALTVLHDTLDAKQRKELVDLVSAKMDKRGGHEGKRDWKGGDDDGDDARADHRGGKGREGREAGNHKRGEGKRGEAGDRGGEMRGPMGHLLQGIELTDAQRTQVHEAFAKMAPSEADRDAMKAQHEAGRKAMSERLASFANDSFDATAFVAMPAGAAMHGPDAMMGGMVKMLATVVPLLDATQRAELAKRIEAGPPAGPAKGGKHHHRGE